MNYLLFIKQPNHDSIEFCLDLLVIFCQNYVLGIMMLEDLSQIFMSKEFPNQWLKEYLHLLTRFEVAIQLDHKSILIPSFLPEKPPTLPVTMYPKEVVCMYCNAV